MSRVLILVEGQTEEAFVRDVLGPKLAEREIFLTSTLATTKRVKSGGQFRGGVVSYGKVRYDLTRLLGDSDAALITTMLDYYGLPADFPGMSDRPAASCYARVEHVERAFAADIGDRRFHPYLQLHEFEALLFVDPLAIAARLSAPPVSSLAAARRAFDSPEEINERYESCPSRRITQVLAAYQKALHGPLIAADIGLDTMRGQCPHFDEWIGRLESLPA